jgi:hypothetical protein
MLHARAGYRCARPTPSISSDSACNARPVHTNGSNATEMGFPGDVRFPLDSDRIADIAGGPFRAKRRHRSRMAAQSAGTVN